MKRIFTVLFIVALTATVLAETKKPAVETRVALRAFSDRMGVASSLAGGGKVENLQGALQALESLPADLQVPATFGAAKGTMTVTEVRQMVVDLISAEEGRIQELKEENDRVIFALAAAKAIKAKAAELLAQAAKANNLPVTADRIAALEKVAAGLNILPGVDPKILAEFMAQIASLKEAAAKEAAAKEEEAKAEAAKVAEAALAEKPTFSVSDEDLDALKVQREKTSGANQAAAEKQFQAAEARLNKVGAALEAYILGLIAESDAEVAGIAKASTARVEAINSDAAEAEETILHSALIRSGYAILDRKKEKDLLNGRQLTEELDMYNRNSVYLEAELRRLGISLPK